MRNAYAEKTIETVRDAYNAIAEHFSHTRYAPWKSVDDLLDRYVSAGERILDIGCGNGRFVESAQKRSIHYTGTDISEELLKQARARHPEITFVCANMESLPFPDNSFDHLLLVASFHHIPSRTKRIATLKEFARIVKPGGVIMMTNWNLYQLRYWSLHLHTLWTRILHRGRVDRGDVLVPWKSPEGTIQAHRYYHAFLPSELKKLGKKAGLRTVYQDYELHGIETSRVFGQNLVTVLQKKA